MCLSGVVPIVVRHGGKSHPQERLARTGCESEFARDDVVSAPEVETSDH